MFDAISEAYDESSGKRNKNSMFWPTLQLYINFASKSFQKQLAYKFEYFVGILNGLLFIFIFTSLWRNIYTTSDVAANSAFDLEGITAYAIFAMLVRISMTMDDASTIIKVRTGEISLDMIKPMNYFFMLLAESAGQSLFHCFTRVIPILVICMLIFDISFPKDINTYLLFISAWALGYMILFMVNFIVALIAFWTLETFSFLLMKYGLFTIFTGGIVPIDFFPEWIKPIIAFIPFQYMIYVPTALFTGHISGMDAVNLLVIQVAWIVGLGLGCVKMWSSSKHRLVVQGG